MILDEPYKLQSDGVGILRPLKATARLMTGHGYYNERTE